PGWVRVNFNYFLSETVFEYILEAVRLVAEKGWMLLPQYAFDERTGDWHHRRGRCVPAMRLGDISHEHGRMSYPSRHQRLPATPLAAHLADAEAIFARAADEARGLTIDDPPLSEDFEHLRWFPLPTEILAELQGKPRSHPLWHPMRLVE